MKKYNTNSSNFKGLPQPMNIWSSNLYDQKNINISVAMPVVTEDDFFIATNATFAFVSASSIYFAELPFEEIPSPKSCSFYKKDSENGLIYRYSNHWGKVASCNWGVKNLPENENCTYIVAVCSISDFTRNNNGCVKNEIGVNSIIIEIENNINYRNSQLEFFNDAAIKKILQMNEDDRARVELLKQPYKYVINSININC